MRTTTLALSLATTLFLVGCGESGSASGTPVAATTDITVERGPVLDAAVSDANGQMGVSQGNGVYRFTDVAYPVESFGGYIDMNRDGVVNAGDIKMDKLRLKTRAGKVMTLATTLDSNLTQSLLDIGYTEGKISGATPTTDMDIAALSDEVYAYCKERNITDPFLITGEHMKTLQGRIHSRKSAYANETRTAAELERILMDGLNVHPLSDADLSRMPANTMQTIIEALPVVALSDAQKYTLAYMWNEERLAKDMYLTLNTLTPSTTLYNIATKGETKHIAAVGGLIEKYNLNILNTVDYSGGYSAQALEAYTAGEYSLGEITDLYNTLYAKGSTSLQDALEVGCMVEVTDINDLDADIQTVQGAKDLVLIFESLRSGSYSHYWAFDNALKANGVSDGCCSLGDEYCKTREEHPQKSHGSASGEMGGEMGNNHSRK